MTREQAIILLSNLYVYQAKESDLRKALDLAIKALIDKTQFIIRSDGTIEQIEHNIRPKGKWIPAPYMIEWESDAKCSNCGRLVAGALYDYVTCPYCSADMR